MDKYVWISFGSENYLPMALISFKGLIDGFVAIGFYFNLRIEMYMDHGK
jgi:hypothetical protein